MRRRNSPIYLSLLVLTFLVALLCINCTAPETTGPVTTNPTTTQVTTTITATTPPTTTPGTTTVTTTTPVETGDKEFVWAITSGSNTVYLMGSIHVADADTFPLAPVIEDAFASANILVVEVNVNEVDESESLALVLEYGTYPAGETLEDNVPEELYHRLTDKFAAWGIGIGLLKGYRPWFIENLIEVTSLQELGYTGEYGIDTHFLESAIARDMEIVELETAEFQIQLLADIPDDIMIKVIEMNLDEPVTADYIGEMFAYWEDGDAGAMEALLFEGLDEEPELQPYYQSLFTDRNYGMFDKIRGFLEDDKTYFVVVGSGHLVGEEGLLNLLEEAGYTVTQLEG